MGYSGQFVLENDLETPYYIKEQRNWKMDFTINSGDYGNFSIITEDGTKYIFSEKETTSLEHGEDDLAINHDVIVAWYLTEIISSQINEKIVFRYYEEAFSHPILENNSLEIDPNTNTGRPISELDRYINGFSARKINDITLYNNNVAVNKIEFEANTPRLDVASGTGAVKALSRISIFNDMKSAVPIKYFDFDIANVNEERLFLKSIQEFSGDGTVSKPPYLFEYIKPDSLPGRLEYKSDHWGYYSIYGIEFPYIEEFKNVYD